MIKAILKKELLDALRDGKSVATAFFIPVIFAAVSFGMTQFMVSVQKGSQSILLPIDGKENIAPLVDFLLEHGVQAVDAPNNPEAAIRAQEQDLILVVPENFNALFRAQQVATLNLLSDQSRTNSNVKVQRVKALIQHWSTSTGALRLLTRNISPSIATPIQINDINVSSEQRVASKIIAGLPMIILMIAFASGIGIIADMASGERERKSLEPLLINPISHNQIFMGKWAAAIAMTTFVSAIGVALQFASINASPLAQLGLRLDMGIGKYLTIVFLLMPVIVFATALQLFISLLARSFKDAQTYNSIIIMLPMIPGLYLTFNSGNAELWQMFVPLLGPTALIVDVIAGDGVKLLHTLTAGAVSLTCAAGCLYLGIQLLKREKTIFS
ncbi:MAG: ABC transporter permease [Agarilytica sp.]